MLNISRHIAGSGYDRVHCWVNPVALPLDDEVMIITQKLFIKAVDCFSGISLIRSCDGGVNWSSPEAIPVLADRALPDGGRAAFMSSVLRRMPDGKILLILTTFNYNAQNRLDRSRPQRVKYLCFDPENSIWSSIRELDFDVPDDAHVLAVSAQLADTADGFLLPYCFRLSSGRFYSAIVRIRYESDGLLRIVESGNAMTSEEGRGFLEPSLCFFNGKYYFSLRNDCSGFITTSADWRNFPDAVKWCFADGSPLGNRNTMNRLLAIGGKLYLVYTRCGLGNDHVFRNRAPLLIAQVDPEKLCVIPETEQIVVPEHGARLGNFTAVSIDENRAYISVAEWMQTLEPEFYDCRKCELHGADNRIWYVTLEDR